VTTLLIPKQHGTSDTCTMDGEELVLKFVEERSLITLGWVSVFFFFRVCG
jgi:STAM-binding protein